MRTKDEIKWLHTPSTDATHSSMRGTCKYLPLNIRLFSKLSKDNEYIVPSFLVVPVPT